MKIELTEIEVKRLAKVLTDRYNASANLFELAEIKSILQKIGYKIDDWTPTADLTN